MEIKFTDEMNAVLNYSREEAMRTGNYGIGPDHLLLGIIRHGANSACSILSDMEVDLDVLKKLIDEKITTTEQIPYSAIDNIVLTRVSRNILSLSVIEARKSGCYVTSAVHLLLALSRVEAGFGCAFLRNSWMVNYDRIRMLMENSYPPNKGDSPAPDSDNPGRENPSSEELPQKSSLEEFGYDLTRAASEGKLDPVHGRDNEIDRVIQILGRRKKNNAILVGDPGVGKSAIIEGIAIRIANRQVPESIENKKIISLDLASVVAGTKFRGDFEKRLKSIIAEVSGRDDVILFIDEFHTIVGAGKAEGSLDAANILKPALARGEIQCIGATTVEEFTKSVEKDGALDRRFQKIMVEKTDIEETLAILRLIAPKYEQHHKVKYTESALLSCVNLSERYISSRCLPDKAIDVMDEAGSMVRLSGISKGSKTVTPDDIARVVSQMTGIPAGKIARNESEKLLKMSEALCSKVVGQTEAIDKLSRAICRSRAGIKNPDRPIGTFMFFGPTGVGKTLLAKSLAEYLFDSGDNMVRIDMSEYMEKSAVSRLVGAPPGYVGFEENGQLTEPVRQKPYCVVLLDEIEKAHPDIFNLLLQVMEDGRLTDSHGRRVSFRNTIIIMTSNVGSSEAAQRGQGMGYDTGNGGRAFSRAIVEKEAERVFPPEFLGRLDDRIYFNSLSQNDIEKIVDIELLKFKKRVEETGFKLIVSRSRKMEIVSKGFNPRFGARPLRKAFTEIIEDPVSEKLLEERMKKGSAAGGTIKI